MIKLFWDEGFKKAYRKRIKNNKELKRKFWDSIELFAKDPFTIRLKTHKLSGKLKGLWAFSCSYEYRVIFDFIESNEVLLIDIGMHDEVY